MRIRNHLIELVEKYPFGDWDFQYFIKNPGCTLDFIRKHSYLGNKFLWYGELIENPNVTQEIYESDPIIKYIIDLCVVGGRGTPVEFMSISSLIKHAIRNKNFSIEFIMSEARKYDYTLSKTDYTGLSCRKNMPWDYIKSNINQKWNFEHIASTSSSITLDNIDEIKKYLHHESNAYEFLSSNSTVRWENVVSRPTERWNFSELSENLKTHHSPEELWKIVSDNRELTKFPNKVGEWSLYRLYKYIPFDVFMTRIYPKLCTKKHKLHDYNSKYFYLPTNPIFCTPEGLMIVKHWIDSWNFEMFSNNPALTIDIIEELEKIKPNNKWDFNAFSENDFGWLIKHKKIAEEGWYFNENWKFLEKQVLLELKTFMLCLNRLIVLPKLHTEIIHMIGDYLIFI